MVTAPVLHSGYSSCVETVGTPREPFEITGTARAYRRWGVHGCRCYWLRCLREVGHYFLLA